MSTHNTPDNIPVWRQRKERGSLFWMRVMRWLSLLLGRRLSRTVLYGVTLYFLVAARSARTASKTYLARVFGRPATLRELYRHFFYFASTIHDRIYLLNDRHHLFKIRIFGDDALHALPGKEQGCFLFGAHLGSFEVLRTLARERPDFMVCPVMYAENARQVNEILSSINQQTMQNIIQLGQIDSMIKIRQKLQEGALVGLLTDRAVDADRGISQTFLGSPAHFPTGPFRMAAMLRRPVYFMTGLYRGANRYDIHFELLTDFSAMPPTDRNAEIADILARYVLALERHCRSAPFNWFNFFDFWEPEHHDPD